ncbi:hypothetical protein [Streptomyces mirabilis]|uniref:hypothetical protein n=1 Tax=Streptomyces mirabilis TaxID=68239 RepID=UPI0031BB835E
MDDVEEVLPAPLGYLATVRQGTSAQLGSGAALGLDDDDTAVLMSPDLVELVVSALRAEEGLFREVRVVLGDVVILGRRLAEVFGLFPIRVWDSLYAPRASPHCAAESMVP